MKKVLMLGGNGYIGSFLNFSFNNKYQIENIDINWFNEKSEKIDYNILDKNYINKFDSVILLAGHSSVKMCDTDMISSFNNNIRNFVNLLNKLNTDQKFIYASSSSVYGNTDNSIVDESYNTFIPYNYYDLTKFVIDEYAKKSKLNYYGLRFGTVNGWSPHVRTDIMINSMVNSAIIDGHIKLYIKNIKRAILGIKDLSYAIESIIESNNNYPDIYNLASFNSTAENIAKEVSEVCNVPIKEYVIDQLEKISNFKVQTKAYDFSIDSSKFEKLFRFNFQENCKSIAYSLYNNFNDCIKTTRNETISYE